RLVVLMPSLKHQIGNLSLHDALPICLGLDNRADIWIRKDSTAVITLRGTTADMGSILEDFYCAMVPAKGVVKTAKDRSFEYILRSEEHTSELQSRENLVCRLLLEKKK